MTSLDAFSSAPGPAPRVRSGRPGSSIAPALVVALLVGLAGGIATGDASAQTVYRWTDETGKVHYGDTVPDRYRSKASELSVKDPMPPAESRPRMPEGRSRGLVGGPGPAPGPGPASGPGTPGQPGNPAPSPSSGAQGLTVPGPAARSGPLPTTGPGSACAQQWQRYDAAGACFAPYRNANGSLKAEAFQNCTEVARPACTP